PQEIEALFGSEFSGRGLSNAGFYNNPAVDAHLAAAQGAEDFEASLVPLRKAQWVVATGYGMGVDIYWAWLVNLQHVYLVHSCLDIGTPQIEPHGHGWPITAGIQEWRWTCP